MAVTRDKQEERPLRIHQGIARQIGSEILFGHHLPGAAFEGEIEMAERLGVSRTAYREAMRILVAKGLLESRPKAGTHVTPRHRWNLLDPEILAWMFSGTPDERFVRDLFELRGIIEPAAAALAATRRSDAQVAQLRGALAQMSACGLAEDAGQAADRQFHRTILEASDNEALISLAGSIGAAVQWTTRFKQRVSEHPRNAIEEHSAVCESIAAGDPQRAQAAMGELLDHSLEDMKLERLARRCS
ncbi:MAG: FadR family transcriptional regulator [Novosphingobium sp.]|nr:FadR family transcriptional regulator [Novosphingobium sp.]